MNNVFGYRLEIAKLLLKNLHSFWSYLEKPEGGQNDPLSPLMVKMKSPLITPVDNRNENKKQD